MTICVKNKKQLIMKKKLLGVGFVFCSIVAISLAALNGRVKSYSGVSLADLVSTTEVNAECAQGSDWFASGKCLSGTGVCVFSVEYRDCVRISNLILVGGGGRSPCFVIVRSILWKSVKILEYFSCWVRSSWLYSVKINHILHKTLR